MTVRRRFGALAMAILALGLVCAPPARAGGGPENVLLLVNASSWASLTVANQYIQLRKIPAVNVVYVAWTGGIESTDGETLRRQILFPALGAAEKRGIYSQIDYIVYSSDFPCAVNLAADFPKAANLPAQASPTCSLNSATYFFHLLAAKLPSMMSFDSNNYMRSFVCTEQRINRKPPALTHAFRSWYGWDKAGELQEAGGQPYILSTMLAVTSGRGNSVREAIEYLKRSATADGTFPKGTIYFTRTDDVRSVKRTEEVAAAIADLQKLGVAAKVVPTAMPQNCPDVAGLIAGVASFSWAQTRSQILPGAICDNFTSFGGIMTEGSSQTPLTEFLRFGAAGAAGTVIEPYAIPQKFASPNIFVHYARGCTLAEAYYQSLFAPAQVLIVGDALCRPWADIPRVQVRGVEPGGKVSGTLAIEAAARFARGEEVGHFELFVDGRRAGTARPGEKLNWDSAADFDGYHELRVVAIAAGPIATQGRTAFPVTVDNHGHTATMTTTPAERVRWGESLTIDVKAPGMKQIYVLNNGRLLGTIAGEQGQLKVDPSVLGLGPVGLQAMGSAGNALADRVLPKPVTIQVDAPTPLPALPYDRNLLTGMLLQTADKRIVPIQATLDPAWLGVAGVGPEQPFACQGTFDVEADDVYQFQVWHYGSLAVAVDDKIFYNAQDGDFTQRFVPVALAKGQHRVTFGGMTGKSDTKLRVLFGGPGAHSLTGSRFRHPAAPPAPPTKAK